MDCALLSDGLAHFEGREWQIIDPFKHPGAHDVNSITVAPDGDIWLGTDIGAFQPDASTGEWSRFAAYRSICDVMPAVDGTVWLLACDWSLVRLTPGGPRLYEGGEVARISDPELTHGNLLGAVLEDTGLWVIGDRGLAWWDSLTAEWTIYTPATTGNALPPYYVWDFDQAADGALWLATQKEGLIRARPKEGEWTLVNAPVLFEYLDRVEQLVMGNDGSIWLATDPWDTVYRCEL
jgi:ligand-binding sensor domain-containing protein